MKIEIKEFEVKRTLQINPEIYNVLEKVEVGQGMEIEMTEGETDVAQFRNRVRTMMLRRCPNKSFGSKISGLTVSVWRKE